MQANKFPSFKQYFCTAKSVNSGVNAGKYDNDVTSKCKYGNNCIIDLCYKLVSFFAKYHKIKLKVSNNRKLISTWMTNCQLPASLFQALGSYGRANNARG